MIKLIVVAMVAGLAVFGCVKGGEANGIPEVKERTVDLYYNDDKMNNVRCYKLEYVDSISCVKL